MHEMQVVQTLRRSAHSSKLVLHAHYSIVSGANYQDALCESFSRSPPSQPILFKNVPIAHPESLSLDSLVEKHAEVMVPVELSKGDADYRDAFRTPDSGKIFQADVYMPFSQLADHINTLDGTREGQCTDVKAYLAQKNVKDVLPSWPEQPIALPKVVTDKLFQQSIWLGPRGTRTPLHCDPYYNLLFQVWGTKAVRIFPPESKHSLYPYPSGPLRNTSQIHATASVDHSQFPDFLGTKGIEVELKSGQALYMPPKHWHEVVSLSGSLSLSYWWI